MIDSKTINSKNAFIAFFQLIKSEAKSISSIYILAILSGIISLSLPLGIQSIINFTQGGRLSTSWVVLIVAITIGIIFSGYLNIFQIEIIEKIQQRFFVKSGFNFTLKLASSKVNLADGKNPDKVSNLFFETINFQKGLYKFLSEIITAIVQLIFGIFLLSLYNTAFLLFGVLLILLLIIIIRFSTSKGLSTSLMESNEKYNMVAWLQQIGRNHTIFNPIARTSHLFSKSDHILNNYVNQRTNHFAILKFQYWNIIIFKAIISSVLLIIGSILVVNGQINLGQFVASEIIVLLVINSAEKIIFSMDSIYDLLTASVKLKKIEELDLEVDLHSKFNFNEIFSSDTLTLENKSSENTISILINRGEFIELLKNDPIIDSLKKLVLYKPEEKITLNSIPLKTINTTSLRKNIALCGFSLRILNGSLLENITLQNNIEDIPKIYNLASILGFDLVIDQLPNGMETILNEYTLENDNQLKFSIELLRKLYFMPNLLIVNLPDFLNPEVKNKMTSGLKSLFKNHFLILIQNV
jgi:ABC-type bacteriocin/lantibiotic exporter with double-glycine peptidase domain